MSQVIGPTDVVAGRIRADHPAWKPAEVYLEAMRAALGEGEYADLYRETAREFKVYRGKEPTHYEPQHQE